LDHCGYEDRLEDRFSKVEGKKNGNKDVLHFNTQYVETAVLVVGDLRTGRGSIKAGWQN